MGGYVDNERESQKVCGYVSKSEDCLCGDGG